jgi:Tfp pilus assembly protein PilX
MKNLRRPVPQRQRGVVLFIALIVLVAMTLAGIAMMRSVDTALGIAGNMSFKQATLQGSDNGVQTAFGWLTANAAGTTLQNDSTLNGYYSSQPGTEPNWFDPSDAIWNNAVTVGTDAAGNTIKYVIHRMCTQANTPYNGSNAGVPNACALYTPTTGGSAGSSMAVGSVVFIGQPQVYYRVTTRVDGPHNAASVVQVSILITAT